MTTVSAVPFALGLVGGLLLFAAWLPFAVRESRRPVHWRAPVRPSPSPVAVAVPAVEQATPSMPRPAWTRPVYQGAHVRIAVVIAAFTVWSVGASLRRIDHHHH